ncbi:MAG: HIT domain-containing protein [Chitinivibrionales bacterium]|nr:HIT domain-containing protein [Chitinivibrionales bacterium]
MNSDRLWAPWRKSYITGVDKKDNGCIFCEVPRQKNEREALILLKGTLNYIIMNLYPYNNGHLMVVPYEHTADMLSLSDDTSNEMWKLLCTCKKALSRAFNPDGFNIGINQGRVAGAGIDQHIHMHIVPRWSGDTNFMPVVGETKVISQDLWDAYDELKNYF